MKGVSYSLHSVYTVVSRIVPYLGGTLDVPLALQQACKPAVSGRCSCGCGAALSTTSDAIAEMKLLILCATDAGPGPGQTDRHSLSLSKQIHTSLAHSERIIRRSCPHTARSICNCTVVNVTQLAIPSARVDATKCISIH